LHLPGQRLSAVACNEDVQFRTAGWPRRLSTFASSSTTSGRAWDRNPLHYDLEAATASRFGEVVVQGGVTSAILNAVVAEKLPGPGDRLPERLLELHAPVRPDDAITGRVEVVEARQDKPITRCARG
jgi:acyl dehydratase